MNQQIEQLISALRVRIGRREAAVALTAGIISSCDNTAAPEPPADVSGDWAGMAAASSRQLPVKFEFSETATSLSGQLFFGNADTGEFLQGSTITGTRHGSSFSAELANGGTISGEFLGDRFIGTLRYPAREGYPEVSLPLDLDR